VWWGENRRGEKGGEGRMGDGEGEEGESVREGGKQTQMQRTRETDGHQTGSL
jgi:hypothetical protein